MESLLYPQVQDIIVGAPLDPSTLPKTDKDIFPLLDSLPKSFATLTPTVEDVQVISRCFSLIYKQLGKKKTAGGVYMLRIFIRTPVFVSEDGKSHADACGSYGMGIGAIKQLKSDYVSVMALDSNLMSIAGVHCFLVKNMHIARLTNNSVAFLSLRSTCSELFDSETIEEVRKAVKAISQTPTRIYSLGFQLIKIVMDTNFTTEEGVALAVRRYDDLLSHVYKQTLIMKF